jgi:hypothetical protein
MFSLMTSRDPTRRPLALVVSAGGHTNDTVRAALKRAGIVERVVPPSEHGWDTTERPDLIVIDGTDLDLEEILARAAAGGRLDPAVPLLGSAPGPIDSNRQRQWLTAGLWEVITTPTDDEALALFLTNLLRGRSPPASAIADDDGEAEANSARAPYAWRILVRATAECLSLASRHGRPLACVAVVPEWPDPDVTDRRTLLTGFLAPLILGRVRKSDLVGMSDDAVLAVLPDTGLEGATVLRERLIRDLRREVQESGMTTAFRVAATVALEEGGEGGDSATRFLRGAVEQAR